MPQEFNNGIINVERAIRNIAILLGLPEYGHWQGFTTCPGGIYYLNGTYKGIKVEVNWEPKFLKPLMKTENKLEFVEYDTDLIKIKEWLNAQVSTG